LLKLPLPLPPLPSRYAVTDLIDIASIFADLSAQLGFSTDAAVAAVQKAFSP
jgi:hypothetical protein